jgi:Zn-dependent alcohol dehydrogenase
MSDATTTAAVCRQFDRPLEIETLELQAPGPTEALVRMEAAGVCLTDVMMQAGALPVALPMVLGHEGSGVVEAVGTEVTRVKPGDRVVMSWIPQCGACFFCRRGQPHLCEPGSRAVADHTLAGGETRLRADDGPVRQLSGLGTFATSLVAMQDALVPVGDDVPFEVASLIGCAVLTGFGAAVNTADIRRGDTVVVVGCGGVGQSIIQGALICGAERVIAVDIDAEVGKIALARGATDFVPNDDVALDAVLQLTAGRGADVVLESVGRTEAMTAGLAMTRRGGQFVVAGMTRFTDAWTIAPMPQFTGAERRILGCRYGSCDIARDVPRIVEHYRAGELALSDMLGRRVPLDRVNDFFDHPAPRTGRPVVTFG